MENQALVSIAMCTHNGEKYLLAQLDSIVNQTYANIEIIIVDDCSSDGTVGIIKSLMEHYPQIKLHINEQNLGYVKNFEKAITLCNGEYIALADQDDIWDLNKISLLTANIGHHTLIYHDSEFINDDGSPINKQLSETFYMYEGNQPEPFFFYNCVSGHAILFRKSLSPKFLPLNKSFYHDWQIAITATENGGIKYFDKSLVKYRQHSLSSTDFLRIKEKKYKKKSTKILNNEWFTFIKSRLNSNPFLEKITNYYQPNNKLKSSKRIHVFFLILAHYNMLFIMKKKGFLSKIFSIFKASIN